MKRLVLGIGFVLAIVVAAFAVFFPTEDLVRRAAAGFAGSLKIDFRAAHLRPWGLVVDDVTVSLPDGHAVMKLAQIGARPSLRGILDRTGSPWHVWSSLCAGDLAFDADVANEGGSLDATWSALQLDRCGFPPPFDTFKGTIAGTTTLSSQRGRANGGGHFELGGIVMPLPEGGKLGIGQLQIDQLTSDWKLDGDTIRVASLSVKTPEVVAQGDGTIQTRAQIGDSRLQLRLTAKAQPYAPDSIRQTLAGLPKAPGEPDAHLVIIEGTINAPQVVQHE